MLHACSTSKTFPLNPGTKHFPTAGSVTRRFFDGLRRGVGRDRVLPRSNRRVPVVARLDHVEGADGAGAEELPGLRVDGRAHALAAHDEAPMPMVAMWIASLAGGEPPLHASRKSG